MATDFLQAAGTNGFITTPFSLLTTELNTLGSGSAATSSVNGTSGVFNQTSWASAVMAGIYFVAGGSFTPVAGQTLNGWFLESPDGGSTFESTTSTPSTTVAALSRGPDFTIPLDNAAYASGKIRWAQGRYVRMPFGSCKILLQNSGASATALPSSGNIIKCAPVALQY